MGVFPGILLSPMNPSRDMLHGFVARRHRALIRLSIGNWAPACYATILVACRRLCIVVHSLRWLLRSQKVSH